MKFTNDKLFENADSTTLNIANTLKYICGFQLQIFYIYIDIVDILHVNMYLCMHQKYICEAFILCFYIYIK